MMLGVASRHVRAALAAAAIAVGLPIAVPTHVSAFDPHQDEVRIERIQVPADQPHLWPESEGDWRPLPRQEFDAFLERLHDRAALRFRSPYIRRADYTANFVAGALRRGRVTWSVAHPGDRPELLTLSPFNLALAPELRDSEGELAVWGTASGGETRLIVTPGRTQFVGGWGIDGRRLSNGIEFDIEIPGAQMTRFRLTLPEGQSLKSSSGIVSEPIRDSQTMTNEWRIELGGETNFRVTVSAVEESGGSASPTVLATRNTHYVMHEDGCSLRADFLLEVPETPLERIQFSVPNEAQILTVTYGDDAPLPWNLVETDRNRLINIVLPDPLHGRGHAIGIKASADITPDALQPLPQIILDDAAFLGGQIHVDVRRPLELTAFEPIGCRQTSISFDGAGGESFTFDQFAANAQLNVRVDDPLLDLTTRQISLINVERQSRLLTCDIEWQAVSGSTFEVFCGIPPGWEIVDIQAGPESKLAGWQVKQTLAEKHLLILEFRAALDASRAKRVRVTSRELAADTASPLPVPPISPLGCTSAGMVLGVSRSESAPLVSAQPASLEPLDTENRPDLLPDSDLWKSFEPNTGRPMTAYVSTSPNPGGLLEFEQTSALQEARARVGLTVSSQRVREEYRATIRPRTETPVERVYAYLTTPGSDISWKVREADGEVPIVAKRGLSTRFHDWGFADTGELWELRLPSPRANAFDITGVRTRAITSPTLPSLLFIPEAAEFQGVVDLKSDVGVDVSATASGMMQDSQHSARDAAILKSVTVPIRWLYQSTSDDLSLEVDLRDTAVAELRNAAVLKLDSVLSADEGEFDVHRATFEVVQPSRSQLFGFRLPEPAELLGVELNDRSVNPSARGEEYELPRLPQQSANHVSIEYRTPASAPSLWQARSIVVPQTTWDVMDFQWRFSVPPQLAPVEAPGDLLLEDRIHVPTWSERVFGPLGRGATGSWFNPFAAGIQDQQETIRTNGGFGPEGWRVYRATAPQLPQDLSITIQDPARLQSVAWIGVFGCLVLVLFFRKLQAVRRPIYGAAWLSALLACSVASTSAIALVWGGCLGGSLIGILWPRRWLTLNQPGAVQIHVPEGSTVQLSSSRVTLLLLLLGMGAQALAQNDTSNRVADDQSAATSTVDEGLAVLVPVDADADEAPVVYVTPSLLSLIQKERLQQSQSTDYLISSASYETDIEHAGPALVEARYRVTVLAARESIRVLLPLTNIHLAGPDAGRVDGQARPVYRTSDGLFVDVRSDASAQTQLPRTVELSLRFYPAASARDSFLDFGIPPVATNRLTVTIGAGVPEPTLPGIGIDEESRLDELATTFGRLKRLRLKRPGGPIDSTTSALSARMYQHVEVRPLGLNYRVHVAYRVLRGEVDHVNWRIPPGFVVRKIESEQLITRTLNVTDDGQRILRIELPTPESGNFNLSADLFLALAESQDVVSVPVLALADSGGQSSAAWALNQFGVSTTSEFELSSLTPDDESVTSISPDSFGEGTAATADLGKPQFTYRVVQPADRMFHIAARIPSRRIRATQEATIDLDAIDWKMNAEIEVDSAAALQHVLRVDPALKIRSVSVREGGAERLARWWRDGNHVTLFLKDRIAGLQNVVLHGGLPTRISAAQPLPVIGFEDADVTESTLLLYRQPGVDVEIKDSDSLESKPHAVLPDSSNSGLIGLGAFTLPSGAEPPRIRVRRSTSLESLETFTQLHNDGRDWVMRQTLVLRNLQDRRESLRVSVPAELADGYRIEGLNGGAIGEKRTPDRLQITLDRSNLSDQVSFILKGALSDPEGDQWELPLVAVDNLQPRRCFLGLVETVDWRPMDAVRLGPAAVPPDLAKMWTLQSSQAIAYRKPSPEWMLTRTKTKQDSAGTRIISSIHTRIWLGVGRDGTDYGRTRVEMSSGSGAELKLDWPQNTQVRAAMVHGAAVAFESTPDGSLTFAGETLPDGGSLDIHWSAALGETFPRMGTWAVKLPSVRGVEVRETQVTLIPPTNRRLVAATGLNHLPKGDGESQEEVARNQDRGGRHVLNGRLSGEKTAVLSGWVYSDVIVRWIAVATLFPLVFLGLRVLLQSEAVSRVIRREWTVLAIAGTIWWLFLAWSPGGMALLMLAFALGLWVRRAADDDEDFIDASGGSAEIPQGTH